MAQDAVEVVRRSWEVLERSGIEASLECYAPDAVVDLTGGRRMDAGVHHGRVAIRHAYEIWAAPWDFMVMEPKEFIPADGDQVIVRFEARGRSSHTGLDFTIERYWVYKVRDGLVARLREFETLEEAVAAAEQGT